MICIAFIIDIFLFIYLLKKSKTCVVMQDPRTSHCSPRFTIVCLVPSTVLAHGGFSVSIQGVDGWMNNQRYKTKMFTMKGVKTMRKHSYHNENNHGELPSLDSSQSDPHCSDWIPFLIFKGKSRYHLLPLYFFYFILI